MIQGPSRPSLVERVFSVKGVLSVLCLVGVVFFVVKAARGAQFSKPIGGEMKSQPDSKTQQSRDIPSDAQRSGSQDSKSGAADARNLGPNTSAKRPQEFEQKVPKVVLDPHQADIHKNAESISVTLYSRSGILVKDFPKDVRFLKIAAKNDERFKPRLQQCGELAHENEFFISEATIDRVSNLDYFVQIEEDFVSSGKSIGLWVCAPASGNKAVFWHVTAAYNIEKPTLTVTGKHKLSLTN
eukprot:718622_1